MGFAAIIIASFAPADAGQPVALWPWDGDQTLVEYQIDQLITAGVRDIEVVLGCEADRIVPAIARDNVEPIIDARWASGPASSLRVGASAVPRGADTVLVMRIDEPRPAWIIEQLIGAHFDAASAATTPEFDGALGSPVIVGQSLLAALRNLSPADADLQTFAAARSADFASARFDTPVVLHRIDSAAGCEDARRLFER